MSLTHRPPLSKQREDRVKESCWELTGKPPSCRKTVEWTSRWTQLSREHDFSNVPRPCRKELVVFSPTVQIMNKPRFLLSSKESSNPISQEFYLLLWVVEDAYKIRVGRSHSWIFVMQLWWMCPCMLWGITGVCTQSDEAEYVSVPGVDWSHKAHVCSMPFGFSFQP